MANNVAALEQWNREFSSSRSVKVVEGQGKLPKVVVESPVASAEIYLHGAQITSWKPAGFAEVLFLSEDSRFEEGKAIRGGIPICFPWFRGKADDAKAPAHGFVRTRAWEIDSIEDGPHGVSVTFSTHDDEASRKWWPHGFRAEYRVTVGDVLALELSLANTGKDSFQFEEALHTYHHVGDAEQVRVEGLDGVTFLDNMHGNRSTVQQGPVVLSSQTDNAYLATAGPAKLMDPVLGRAITTTKQNSSTTVVWNPWQQGAAALKDLGDEEWRAMACVEASNILESAITLAPGAKHLLAARLEVERS